jgi:hypothetical protein
MPWFSRSKKKALPMSMVGFPLLLIPLAIYNILVFLMPGVSLAEPIVKLTLMSGAEWPLTLSDMLLALGIVLLLLEVIKGARPGAKYLTDHLLSLVVFGGAAAEFLLWPRFGTSTYFLLALLGLVDFLSGLALRSRRGVPVASGVAVSRRGARQPAPAPEPHFDPVPAPAPSMPAAASVAEAVLMDHPEPKIVEPKILEPKILEPKILEPKILEPKILEPKILEPKVVHSSIERSGPPLEVPSPGLQPGNGSPPSPDEPLK